MVRLMHKYESPVLAKRAFKKKYPALDPAENTFTYNVKKYSMTQSCHRKKHKKRPSLVGERTTINKAIIVRNPDKSIREIANETGIPKTCVQEILTKVLKLKPCKKVCRHKLLVDDYGKRRDACYAFLDLIRSRTFFTPNIVFTDEATFYTNGTVCSQNSRWWSAVKPDHFSIKLRQAEKVTVWCAIHLNGIIGPYYFYDNVCGENYLTMLREYVEPKLAELCLLGTCIFQQDGAWAHYS
ncbi:hypothetical protein TrispH2_002851 [Trichoplax sp. H2]|nr:hypothetical protein TrispH2_002851 [Trichoplax sp. H2]|eukprot:RDD44810.1 hypothetical protein TrispH2_002851 [Trichoplax sp. H2]